MLDKLKKRNQEERVRETNAKETMKLYVDEAIEDYMCQTMPPYINEVECHVASGQCYNGEIILHTKVKMFKDGVYRGSQDIPVKFRCPAHMHIAAGLVEWAKGDIKMQDFFPDYCDGRRIPVI